jgi:1-pyrroline-5-carboxylate dehydrogenase
MFANLPKNLVPCFRQSSLLPFRVKEIVEDVLVNPIKIPNYLGFDNPVVEIKKQISPYNNKKHVAEYQNVDHVSLKRYFNTYEKNKKYWQNTPYIERREVFLNAANLLETKYYHKMLAYTIVGQNKNIYEAEIDAICELVDFLRFNVAYADNIMTKQPLQTTDIKNISEYNALNGFVAAITPFNFTAIGGNLASAPLLFGNSVIWKPSDNAILSNHLFYQIMLEAGLPEGVLNFCPMNPKKFLSEITIQKDLSAVLFTGSSTVFDNIYERVSKNCYYKNNYPRIIGETGGKNFHFMDTSCNNMIDYVVEKTIESAFNYSGQKCSACSIMYVPEDLLPKVLKKLKIYVKHYLNNIENYGVISKKSYDKVIKNIDLLKKDNYVEFAINGNYHDYENYYIEPNVVVCEHHNHKVFNEEFFAPILAIYPYKREDKEETMNLCINSNNYALTGAVFSQDNKFLEYANNKFRSKTGNFYINDKSTGSVVGQQPFGGSGKSGTNDKAGDINLLFRLFNQRNIKTNLSI